MSLEISPNFLLNFSRGIVTVEEKHFYRFKSFRLIVEERQLLDDDSPVPLTPRAFDALALLVKRSGHLVEKEELLQTVWADSFVEESNVARVVHTLRRTLGEDENGNKFIETVAKKGYRFIAEVVEICEPSVSDEKQGNGHSAAAAENLSAPDTATKTSEIDFVISDSAAGKVIPLPVSRVLTKTRVTLFAIGFLSAVLLFLLASFNFQPVSNFGSGKVRSIAVLPLKPIMTANRDEFFEIGIADSLIHQLGSIKGFVVRPLSSTRKYADLQQDPISAGKEQQVDYVLASNYQLAGGKIRITAQLFNVANGQIEETYKGEKEISDVFAMQDSIAGEIGKVLLSKFNATTLAGNSTAKRGTTNEEAYRFYLQARYLVDKRNLTDTEKSIQILEQALRLDPNYPQAWALKAYAYNTKTVTGRNINPHDEYRKSIEAINRALALDENLADARSAFCEAKMHYEWDFQGAERECKRAIELDPNSSLAHQTYARFLMTRGRFEEVFIEAKTAIDLDPTSLFNQRVYGIGLYYARRYNESVRHLKGVLEMDLNNASIYPWLIGALEMQGNHSEAFEWQARFQALLKTDEETRRTFSSAFRASGWEGVVREQARMFDGTNHAFFFGACLNAQIGDKDRAFEYLERSFERREWVMGYLQVDPRLDPLRDDPRYKALVERVELN